MRPLLGEHPVYTGVVSHRGTHLSQSSAMGSDSVDDRNGVEMGGSGQNNVQATAASPVP